MSRERPRPGRERALARQFARNSTYVRKHMCADKKRHRDEFSATVEAFIMRIFVAPGEKIRAYRCAFCRGWHTGHVVTRGGVW